MTNKLQDRAQKSKLQRIDQPREEQIFPLNRTVTSSVHSFRLDWQSYQDLQNLVKQVNQASKRKVSASRLIKALIYLGKISPEDKVLKALKEIAV